MRECVESCSSDYIIDRTCVRSLAACDYLNLDYFVSTESSDEYICNIKCSDNYPYLSEVTS